MEVVARQMRRLAAVALRALAHGVAPPLAAARTSGALVTAGAPGGTAAMPQLAGIGGVVGGAQAGAAASSSDLLGGLWDGLMMAVPKRKVSPSRRKKRLFHRRLKPRQSFWTCPNCGDLHLPHHLCLNCHRFNGYMRNKHVKPKNVTFE